MLLISGFDHAQPLRVRGPRVLHALSMCVMALVNDGSWRGAGEGLESAESLIEVCSHAANVYARISVILIHSAGRPLTYEWPKNKSTSVQWLQVYDIFF